MCFYLFQWPHRENVQCYSMRVRGMVVDNKVPEQFVYGLGEYIILNTQNKLYMIYGYQLQLQIATFQQNIN